MTLPTTIQYWLAPNSVNITLNANDNPNLIQVDTPADAAFLCYMPNVPELDYDVNHNFRKWYIKSANVCFNTDTPKYVYLRIPRTQAQIHADPLARDASGNDLPAPADQHNAELCYPSDHIDIYGVHHTNIYDVTNDKTTQKGSRQYLYVWLQAIITANTGKRQFQQNINFGTLRQEVFYKTDDPSPYTIDYDEFTKLSNIRIDLCTSSINLPASAFENPGSYNVHIPGAKQFEGKTILCNFMIPEKKHATIITNYGKIYGEQIRNPKIFDILKADFFYCSHDNTHKMNLMPDGQPLFANTNLAPLMTRSLELYGAVSFVLTSVRMRQTTENYTSDWVWVVSGLEVFRAADYTGFVAAGSRLTESLYAIEVNGFMGLQVNDPEITQEDLKALRTLSSTPMTSAGVRYDKAVVGFNPF